MVLASERLLVRKQHPDGLWRASCVTHSRERGDEAKESASGGHDDYEGHLGVPAAIWRFQTLARDPSGCLCLTRTRRDPNPQGLRGEPHGTDLNSESTATTDDRRARRRYGW